MKNEAQSSQSWKRWFGLSKNIGLGNGRDFRLAGWMLLALLCGFIAYVARMHEVTHDAFHEMSLYRESLALGTFPQEDVFAYTPTVSPSVHHEWATGAVLYYVTVGTGLGLAGLSILKLLLMATLWLLMYRVARMRGAHPAVFAAFAFIAFPVFWVGFATVRAQLFTLVFIAAQLWMQELDWRGRRAWILAWLVMLVAWLNIHAGFVVGLGLIAFHGVERFLGAWIGSNQTSIAARLNTAFQATWHLMVAAPLAALSTLINPYGWQYIPYLVRAIGMDRPLIREWQPLWKTYTPGLTMIVFVLSVALFLYAQRSMQFTSRFRRASRFRGFSFLALCTYMTLKHIRHGSIYGVLWIAYVPAWISRTPLGKGFVRLVAENRKATIRVSQGIAVVCFLFACFHHFWLPSLPPKQLYSTACYPTGAVEYLKENNFQGNLMTPFHVGAYVSWEMYPHVRVSFDGRYEVAYQENVMPEHNQFLDGDEGWWNIMDKYPTDAVLVHRQAPVCEKLEIFRDQYDQPTKKTWRFAYEDDSFLVLSKSDSTLPYVDHRGQQLTDGAWEAFSDEHAHWNRNANRVLAER